MPALLIRNYLLYFFQAFNDLVVLKSSKLVFSVFEMGLSFFELNLKLGMNPLSEGLGAEPGFAMELGFETDAGTGCR